MSATEVETESEAQINVITVDEMQNYGINASDLQKLKSSGIYTVNVCREEFTLLLDEMCGYRDTNRLV